MKKTAELNGRVFARACAGDNFQVRFQPEQPARTQSKGCLPSLQCPSTSLLWFLGRADKNSNHPHRHNRRTNRQLCLSWELEEESACQCCCNGNLKQVEQRSSNQVSSVLGEDRTFHLSRSKTSTLSLGCQGYYFSSNIKFELLYVKWYTIRGAIQ